MCDFAYIDSSNDFNFYIGAEPLSGTLSRTWSFLANASGDSSFGSQGSAYPMQQSSVGITSGGVTYDGTVASVTVSPDNAPDYQAVTTRGLNFSFSSLQNEVADYINATSGIYVKAAGDSSSVIQTSQSIMLTAAAVLKGNRHIIINEQNADGTSVTRVVLGNLTTNQNQQTLARTKTAVALVQFNLQTASQDTLLRNMDSVITYSRA